jgi:hypothetical protein
MQFSETVQASSIVAKEMTLRSSQSSNAVSQALAFKSLPGQDSDTLTLELSAATSNAIKKSTGLAKDLKTTYLAVTTAALTDMNKNKVASIGTDKALVASKFTADTKAPSLLQADLNMNAGELTLRFSETVQVSTFNATQIVIQNANIRDQAQSVQLSSASTSNSADGTVVIVNLSEKDTNAIKAAASLATVSNTDAFVAVTKTAIKDMNTNNVEAKTLRVTAFTKDVSKPKLVDFDLNMDAKQLELRFSETVNGQTMNVKMLKFVNGKTVSTAKADFTLSPGATFTTSATHKIVVDITEADANKIKALTTLCSAKTDTFLVIDGGTVEDMRGNPVPKDSMGVDTAMVVKEFKPDGGKPTLSSFDAVMDNGAPPVKLVLKFSEAVDATSLDTSKIVLYDDAKKSNKLTLAGGAKALVKGSLTDVVVTVDAADLKRMRDLESVGRTPKQTFVELTADSIKDHAKNGIATMAPVPATTFSVDVTPPTVSEFIADFAAETLTLVFSEKVEPNKFTPRRSSCSQSRRTRP